MELIDELDGSSSDERGGAKARTPERMEGEEVKIMSVNYALNKKGPTREGGMVKGEFCIMEARSLNTSVVRKD